MAKKAGLVPAFVVYEHFINENSESSFLFDQVIDFVYFFVSVILFYQNKYKDNKISNGALTLNGSALIY